MGLAWQQGPLATGAVGRFLVPAPLPERLLFAEPLRRRMRVRFGDAWVADSEDTVSTNVRMRSGSPRPLPRRRPGRARRRSTSRRPSRGPGRRSG